MKLLRPYRDFTATGTTLRIWVMCVRCQRHFSNVDAALLHAEKVHPQELRVPEPEEFR